MSLYDHLRKNYPKILGNISIDCGEGWYPLLKTLCGNLQWNTDNNKYPQVVAKQVKEKFGTLRFYADFEYHGDQIESKGSIHDGAISFAESMSGIICDECGAVGRLRSVKADGPGWMRTLCDKHATVNGYKLDEESPIAGWMKELSNK